MTLPDKTTVLIVGAGPTGLAAALSLLHHGFRDFLVVDAASRVTNSSRAVAVHAATLEALDMIGCGDDIVSQGIKYSTFSIGTRSTKLISTYLGILEAYTRHPYALVIPQDLTELTLEKKLKDFGIVVHRPLIVAGLKRNIANPEFSDVAFEDGRVIVAEYVIGADGVRSVIRDMAGIGFSDPTNVKGEVNNNLSQAVIGDVIFDTVAIDPSALSGTLSPNNFFLCFQLPSSFNESLSAKNGQAFISERIYRIGCGGPLEDGEIPRSPSKEYLQSLVDRFGPCCGASYPITDCNSRQMRIKDVISSSRYRNRNAIADETFIRLSSRTSEKGGVIILIGDAAHALSAVGGHGMNLGMRDAIFLGEALTNHIRAAKTKPTSEADKILHEFARVRSARALEVIGLTQGLMSVLGMKYRERMGWWCPVDSATVQAWTLWVLGCVPFVRRRLAWELSGLNRM